MIKTPLSTVIGGAFWTPKATILGGTSKTIDQIIKSLFANNEQGFFYDPNDLSTMFQDAAGTVPVTGAGKPVGLMLDKSRGLLLGENVVVNGGFDLNGSGWGIFNGGWSTVDGKAVLSGNGASQVMYQSTLTTGKWYHYSFDVQSTGGDIGLEDSNGAIVAKGSTGRVSGYYLANGSRFGFKRYAGYVNGFIDNVSMKELQGNHAYQTTSAASPLLQNSPRKIDYDGVDDKLITNLPAQLTGCTVIRSIPNVGTQILTGQTIPTTYNDNTDHCGLIVINRALTATETSQITKLFNKAAGV